MGVGVYLEACEWLVERLGKGNKERDASAKQCP
jgi:hypothetical protein